MQKDVKIFFSLIMLISIIQGCQKSIKSPAGLPYQESERVYADSLDKLDSLVSDTRLNDSAKSINFARQALSLAQQRGIPFFLAKANIMMGTAYFNQKTDSSFIYFNRALKIADKYNLNQLKPTIFLGLSDIYQSAFDYQTSIVLLDSAIRLAYVTKDYENLSTAYNNLGNIKYDLHDFSHAKQMYDSAYNIASRFYLNKQMGVALGSLSHFEKDVSKAVRVSKQAVELLKKSPGTEEAVARIWINIGIWFEDPDSAIKYYNTAIKTVTYGTSPEVIMIAYNNLVYSYIDKREYSKAELCLTQHAIPLAEKLMNNDWLATLYDSYNDLLMSEGKSKPAAIAEKKAYKYREMAYDFKVTGQVRLLAALLDVKNKEIKLKSIDEELQRKSNKVTLLSILFIFFSGITIFIILWIIQKNKLKSEKERLSSARKVIALDENLKGRLALELHDMTSPLYTTLLREIKDVEIPDMAVKDELYASLTLLAERMRRISHEMSGNYFEQLTFHEIVQSICEEMQYRTDAQIKLQMDQNKIELETEKGKHIIRIIQELLTNGVKYVKKGEISLSISIEFENMNIIYYDNGAGFNVQAQSKTGLGLTNIFERTKLLGGKAFLEASPTTGTHWNVRIPMK